MNINAVDLSFQAKVKRENSKKVEDKPDFFRDNELFDEEKDDVTADYFTYNDDDYPIHMNEREPLFILLKSGEDRRLDLIM